MNVYACCPEVTGERFALRLVTEADVEDLLKVYSDEKAVPLFNSDNCHGDDFHYTTRERMLQGIQMWLWSYGHGWFVRWSIVDKGTQCAVGTIELFTRQSENRGILRLDLRSDYEKERDITEILAMLLPDAFDWFGCGNIATKAKPMAAERIRALKKLGFRLDAQPLYGEDGTAYGDYYGVDQGEALHRIAMMHIYGDGAAEDNALAAKLLDLARGLGHMEAAYHLGICYHYGYGVETDLEKALALYREAAEAGYGKGMELVGRFYNRGIYVERNRETAEWWLKRAMESGDPEAAEEAGKEWENLPGEHAECIM